jgi:hypothetical protein
MLSLLITFTYFLIGFLIAYFFDSVKLTDNELLKTDAEVWIFCVWPFYIPKILLLLIKKL